MILILTAVTELGDDLMISQSFSSKQEKTTWWPRWGFRKETNVKQIMQINPTTQRAFRQMANILSKWCELGGHT